MKNVLCNHPEASFQGTESVSFSEAPPPIELSKHAFEPLRKDQDFILYRGRSQAGQTRILALAPAAERPGPESLKRLDHEYSLREVLDPAWAVRPIRMTRHWNRPVLVLEDPGGTPLDQVLLGPLGLGFALHLAIGLAKSIGPLHESGIIHKDLKPANILVNHETGQIWLMGFGIASCLPRERQSPGPPEAIAGTLAYMAPEQTGRMNRSIDSRSDLYSVGVILYEMLTGTLPFTASDPMGWVHCHIARQAVPPAQRDKEIPETISAIVLRLLAKTAEERYQTAAGLEADLRRCLAEWESNERVDPFTLGSYDASDRLLMPEKLYGRDLEIQVLVDSFNEVVATGKPILVLVSGYSGIGKSSIVNELHKAIVLPRGMFISGKFDQHKRDIPYGTLAQAFQSLIRQILAKSDAEVDDWRRVLQEALGSNAQLIIGLIPELELVIGKQPPVVEIPQMEAENRFRSVFRSFLAAFARKEHPLALFLDDLQWADLGTLKLFEDLVTQTDVRHLLLVGAFRDNEVSPAHPLVRTLDAIRQSGAIVREILLGPLSLRDVIEFIADTLRCGQAAAAEPLALLVHQKTLGNPFFAIHFLTALREEHLLLFDARDGTWKWDLEAIHARGFTDNVVELMVSKLERLPIGAREALKQFACLGNSATTRLLATVQEKSGEEVHSDLSEAARQGFVLPLDDSYKFLHDRVQEAAYSLIPEASRAEIHLRIGRILLSRMTPDEVCEKILDVVNQLNLGAALVTGWNEKEQIAKLNLRAGRTAKASAAYASACTYFSVAMALLGNEGWSRCYELAFSVYLERAECEFLSGNFSEAERLIENLLGQDAPKIDKAAVYRVKIDLHVVKSEMALAVNSSLDCLSMLGIEMSAHPTDEEVHAEYEKVWKNLDGRSIGSLIELPRMTNAEMQAAMRTLSLLFVPAVLTDNNLLYLHLCKMVNLSVQYGTTDAAVAGYAWFGIILGPVFHRYEDGYLFGRLACDLVEKFGFAAYRAKANFAMEITVLWTKPATTAIEHIQSAFHAAVEAGDLTVACYSRNHLITDLLLKGAPLEEVWLESERSLDFVRKARFRDNVDVIVSQQRFILNMAGKTSNFSTFSDLHFDEAEFEAQLTDDRMSIMICWYWIMKLMARFYSGDYETAVAASRSAKELLCFSVGHIQLLDYYYYAALSVAALYNTAAPDRQKEFRDLLVAHVAQLQEWAENGSATFRDKFALVSAELARIEHRDLEAMSLYEQAVDSARENGFVHNEGTAAEVAAAFYAARGFKRFALNYLRDARYCYLRWGADGKVRQLDELHPQLREELPAPQPTTTIGTPFANLDLATVVKVSQAISGEIVLEKLIDTLMRTAIEHAGAERGLLILPGGAEQRIAAEVKTNPDEVAVQLRHSPANPFELPESLLRYVIRTKESVTLSDASAENIFSEDQYFRRNSSRSVLCLPLVKQRQLIGILYFENDLAPGVFTPDRLAILELLASQAAISLEQAGLYAQLKDANKELQIEISERKLAEAALEKSSLELRKSEQRLQDIVDNTTAIVFVKDLGLHYLLVNCEFERLHHIGRGQMVGKTDYDYFPRNLAEEFQDNDRKAIEHGAPLQFEQSVPVDGAVRHYVVIKFPLCDSRGKPYAVCGIGTDITALKRAEEMEKRMARERELFAQQRASQLAKANEALRGSLDALAAVPDLDLFLGQVMAAIATQLGAVSATLRLHNSETNRWNIEFVFEHGRVSRPDKTGFPASLRSLNDSDVNRRLQAIHVYRTAEPQSEPCETYRLYLLSVGVKTMLTIPLLSRDTPTGVLALRFEQDREFQEEELEIARALATQASLAIQMAKLAETARQSAVLQERNRLAGEIHDSLAQSFTGISMQLAMAQEVLTNIDATGLSYLQRADDLARFGLAEARRSTSSLQPRMFQDSGLNEALRMLVERSNIDGRLECTFVSNLEHDESLPVALQQDLLRIAQEAISNAVRHARSTSICVTLRGDPPNLCLEIADNGSGLDTKKKTDQGFGLLNMRARVEKLKGSLKIQTAPGRGTRVIVTVPFTP